MFEHLWRRKRKLYWSARIEKLAEGASKHHRTELAYHVPDDRREVTTEVDANLIGSLSREVSTDDEGWGKIHRPVLDIDFPAELVPSKTEGHYHLYLDKDIPWPKYKKLLRALSEAGIIQYGYAEASIAAGQSFVRVPSLRDRYKELYESDG